ncbi:hypothetical protein BDZ97DRAFT_132304 [Flammula alnicola]|nr:hypothetical protein BDZ97DRAFT_132304 [Flammula alnicola]
MHMVGGERLNRTNRLFHAVYTRKSCTLGNRTLGNVNQWPVQHQPDTTPQVSGGVYLLPLIFQRRIRLYIYCISRLYQANILDQLGNLFQRSHVRKLISMASRLRTALPGFYPGPTHSINITQRSNEGGRGQPLNTSRCASMPTFFFSFGSLFHHSLSLVYPSSTPRGCR